MNKPRYVRQDDEQLPRRTWTWYDGNHCPHWERPYQSRSAHAGITISTHVENPYLSITASEYGDRSGKQTMISLNAEEGRALFAWLKSVYEPRVAS